MEEVRCWVSQSPRDDPLTLSKGCTPPVHYSFILTKPSGTRIAITSTRQMFALSNVHSPQLLSTYCVSFIMLGTSGTEINNTDGTLVLPEVTIWRESPTLTKGAGTQTNVCKSLGYQHSKTHKDPSCTVPVVQMRKLRPREGQVLAEGHTARRW